MFDPYFQDELQKILLWHNESVLQPITLQSAFMPFRAGQFVGGEFRFRDGGPRMGGNMKMKVIEFLRRDWRKKVEGVKPQKERSFRHMMNERMRRERQKQCYSALLSVLPLGTKTDKRSVIEAATLELKKCKQELEMQNRKTEANLVALNQTQGNLKASKTSDGEKLVCARVSNPVSGIDSMLEVLKCLKHMGSTATRIQSSFSSQEFSVSLQMDSEVDKVEAEKVIQETLAATEIKLLYQLCNKSRPKDR